MAFIPIQEWLSSIDLGRYEINFLHGGYETVDQCLNLTDTDLITLDITSSGHIKVLLANLKILKRLDQGASKTTNKQKDSLKSDITIKKYKKDPVSNQDEHGQVYSNVQFGQTLPAKVDQVNNPLTLSKKPIPAPRTRSCSSQHQVVPQNTISNKDVIRHNNIYDDRNEEKLNSSHEMVCENDKFSNFIEPPMTSILNRSTSLLTYSLFNKEIPIEHEQHPRKESLATDPSYVPRPPDYVNVDCNFKMKESEEAHNYLLEYENFNFMKQNPQDVHTSEITPDEQNIKNFVSIPSSRLNLSSSSPLHSLYDNCVNNDDDVATADREDMKKVSPSQQSPLTSTRIFLSKVDLRFLENLSNVKIEEECDVFDGSDSPPCRQSLSPPSYPPPPLIISGKEIRDPSESKNRLYPSLPPRPEKTSGQYKHERDDLLAPFSEPAVPPTSSQYCTFSSMPAILPNIPKSSTQNIPSSSSSSSSSSSIPPALVPKTNSTKDLKHSNPVIEDLYCLEMQLVDSIVNQPINKMNNQKLNEDLSKGHSQIGRQAPLPPPKKLEPFSKLEGYLTRQGGEKRWFVLDRENFGCYHSDKQRSLVDIIPVRRIASLSGVCDNKCELSFEIFLKSSNSSLLLTADNLEWKFNWLNKIAKLIACVCEEDLNQIHPFERAGNIYIKSSIDFNLQWSHMTGKSMYIYKEDDKFHHLDLRKILAIRSLPPSKGTKMAIEKSEPIQLEVPDMRISFQGHTRLDTTKWLKGINNAINKLDHTDLYDHFLSSSDVPLIIEKCVNYVTNNGLEVEGIYRLSGQSSKVAKLLEMMNGDARGAMIRSDEFQIHDVSNCLKRFFRQLKEPLFTLKFYSYWVEALSINDVNKRLTTYKNLLSYLPRINHATIKFITTHLVQIVKESGSNKMDSINIASIFGPILVSVDKGDVSTAVYQSTNYEINIVKDFLDNHEFLFDIEEKELEMERTMKEARKKIEQLNQAGLPDAEQAIQEKGMLVSVMLKKDSKTREDDVITTSAPPSMTASDLEEKIKEKLGSRDYKDWKLFEVVCDGELERLIDGEEKVISLLLKYKDWPQELCTDNSLVFKRSDLLSNLLLCLEPKMFLWDNLKFSTKKSFKKFNFEFSRCNLSYRKDQKSNLIESWRIEDLVIYKGVQKKRNPPNEFGLTFYPLDLQLTGNVLGYSLCFHNEMEMYRWLAVLLNAQRPNGLLDGTTRKLSPRSMSSDSCPDLRPRTESRLPVIDREVDLEYNYDQITTTSTSSSSHPSAAHDRPPSRVPSPSDSNLMMSSSCTNIEPNKTSIISKIFSKFTK